MLSVTTLPLTYTQDAFKLEVEPPGLELIMMMIPSTSRPRRIDSIDEGLNDTRVTRTHNSKEALIRPPIGTLAGGARDSRV